MKTKYHNPQRLKYAMLPKGFRFMTKKEFHYRYDNAFKIRSQREIMAYGYAKWNSLYRGTLEDITYCVPIKWKGARK